MQSHMLLMSLALQERRRRIDARRAAAERRGEAAPQADVGAAHELDPPRDGMLGAVAGAWTSTVTVLFQG